MNREILERIKIHPKKQDIVALLNGEVNENDLFSIALEEKLRYVGNKVFPRGLIEYSNVCLKNCFYCGIRKGNEHVFRYKLTDEEVMEGVRFALEHHIGSVVIQAGENQFEAYTRNITGLIKKIKEYSGNALGITLSLGEQSQKTYQNWFDAGAHRYLLRIETSDPILYRKIHPSDANHSFETRLKCLQMLQQIGYQTGTGVLIGLPGQTISQLADDLLFLRDFDVDMVGMGPYLLQSDTPMMSEKDRLLSENERFRLALRMVAVLRLLMPDINIAATTAMQALHPSGRELAVKAGANVIMPNITPGVFREHYALYENKPGIGQKPHDMLEALKAGMETIGHELVLNAWGDPKHFFARTK